MAFQSGVAAVGSGPHLALTWLVAIVLVTCIALFLGMLGVEIWRSVRFARRVAAARRVSVSAKVSVGLHGETRVCTGCGCWSVTVWVCPQPSRGPEERECVRAAVQLLLPLSLCCGYDSDHHMSLI
jgi:hypothetical protein